MPQLFTPKFVDLVRVTTSTQGTGPLVCGPAVAGFSSFADSLSAGDTFYYSVQSTDKPQEREVGRGTYQANNTITRQPLRGSLVIFTSGSKTIALVASSEWYARLQEVSAGADRQGRAETRSALAAVMPEIGMCRYLAEGGRAGTFELMPHAPLATLVAADPQQGIYVRSTANPNYVWVRQFDGHVNVQWFGAKGDSTSSANATNDGPAFLAAIAYLKARSKDISYGRGSGNLLVPAGVYWLNTSTLDITHALAIVGEGGIGGGTMLKWANGTTGIRTQSVNTVGATDVNAAWTDYTAGRTSVRDLILHGGYYGGAESEAHGIHLRVAAEIVNVGIFNFAGDGLYSRATAGGGAGIEGNANGSRIQNLYVQGCRNGVYLDSADANAMTFIGLNCSSNRCWGILDSSFLGNTYLGPHTAANGWDGSLGLIPTACVHNGNRYMVVPGQEAWCKNNPPSGTSATNQGWLYLGAGGTYTGVVTWAAGTTFRSGGAFLADDVNATNTVVGLYVEADQNPAFCGTSPTLFLGFPPGGVLPRRTDGQFYRGILGGDATSVKTVSLVATKDISAFGQMQVGPVPGQPVADGSLNLSTTNATATLNFANYSGSGTTYSGAVIGYGSMLIVDGGASGTLFRKQGVQVASIQSDSLELLAGKVIKINGLQVVSARQTGWTAATGSPNRGTFSAASAGALSATYVQSEAQASRDRIAALEARLIALEADVRTHGLIN